MGAAPATGEVVFAVGGGQRRGLVGDAWQGDGCVLKLRWSRVGFGVFERGLWWAVLADVGAGGRCGDLVVGGSHAGCCRGFELVGYGVSPRWC